MMQEFVQQISDTVNRFIRDVHTAMPGKIIAFDPVKCLASVQPVMKYKKPDGTTIDFPQVTGVPVVFPQAAAQGVSIAFPIKPGDGCLLIVAEQSLDYWQYGQETATDLAFDMTNAVCIPGLFAKSSDTIQRACSENALALDNKGTRVLIKNGEVHVSAKKIVFDGDVLVNGAVTTTGDTVARGISVSQHTHTGDSGGETSPPK